MKGISYYKTMNQLVVCILLFPFSFSTSPLSSTQTPSLKAVVHAVLFYSPNCGHCQFVITVSFPPLFEQYGDQLYIVGVDVTQPDGQVLFMAALQHFNLESGGVPFLVVGDTYLVGSVDIPEKFSGLIEQYLEQGGVDWPAITGLAEAMAPAQSTEVAPPIEATPPRAAKTIPASPTPITLNLTPTPGLLVTGGHSGGLGAKFTRDLLGNTLAVTVLALMLLSVSVAISYFRRALNASKIETVRARWWDGLIPVLCLIGLGVAGYLAYVETAQVEAVCGPVGDCNSVQQSAYARLFGVLPIGILGVIGYLMILLTWAVGRSASRRMAAFTRLALLGLTAFGVLFSIYLTFLEPFVIGATCAWCLTSAIVMTALFWLSLAPAKLALSNLLPREQPGTKRTKLQRTL
jgi:uncharacterized membrane protein